MTKIRFIINSNTASIIKLLKLILIHVFNDFVLYWEKLFYVFNDFIFYWEKLFYYIYYDSGPFYQCQFPTAKSTILYIDAIISFFEASRSSFRCFSMFLSLDQVSSLIVEKLFLLLYLFSSLPQVHTSLTYLEFVVIHIFIYLF